MNTHTPYDRGFRDALEQQEAYAAQAVWTPEHEAEYWKGAQQADIYRTPPPILKYIGQEQRRPNRRQRFFRRLRRWSYSLGLVLALIAYGIAMYCLGWLTTPGLYR